MNKNKKSVFFVLLSLLFFTFVPLKGQGFLMQKDILVPEGEIQDNVISFGGDVLIIGEVKENVVSFGGTVTIEGSVGETVIGFGSRIKIKSSAVVRGDVVALGGMLDKEPGCIVQGDTTFFSFGSSREVIKFFRETLFGAFGISLIPLFLIFKLITLLMWFILAMTMAAIFPRQISYASLQIRKSFWPVFGTGLISLVLFIGFIIFSAFLSLILIGIPILIFLVFLAIIIKIFGQAILYFFFGESLYKAFSKKQPTVFLAVILGFVLVSFLGFIPLFGALFSFVLSVIGWGVVIRTKFGTTENWFNKRAL